MVVFQEQQNFRILAKNAVSCRKTFRICVVFHKERNSLCSYVREHFLKLIFVPALHQVKEIVMRLPEIGTRTMYILYNEMHPEWGEDGKIGRVTIIMLYFP